nr:ATP-dependent DNA helicase PIF1-like [Tanacetum cinerariifolium]
MSTKAVVVKSDGHNKHHISGDVVDVIGTIIVMIDRVWDVSAVSNRYLSIDFVVSNVKADGFVRYPLKLVDLDAIEPTENKYLIDKVYFSSTSSTMILDDVEILVIKALKDANCGMELKNPYMPIDLTRPVKGTIENILIWLKTGKIMYILSYLVSFGPRQGGISHRTVARTARRVSHDKKVISTVNHAIGRYMLEMDVSDNTTQTVIVMFDETATALVGCSAGSWYIDHFIAEKMDKHGHANKKHLHRSFITPQHKILLLGLGFTAKVFRLLESDVAGFPNTNDYQGGIQLLHLHETAPPPDVPTQIKSATHVCHIIFHRHKRIAKIDNQAPNDPMVKPSLSTMLHKSLLIASKTIVGRDGIVHSYCGLKLSDISATRSSKDTPLRYFHLNKALHPTSAPSVMPPCGMLKELTRKYNAPMVSEVAALIINDSGDGIPVRNKNRVFKMKLTELSDDLTKKQIFGDCCAVVYVIEFQKQGLPHTHILLWLEERLKCTTLDEINDIIFAELPSPAEYPDRDNKVTAKNGKFSYNNQHVVSYNWCLLLKYHAHVNVEWCNRSIEIKYLFKYLNKGMDKATIVIYENITADADGASLNYHLPNQNAVTLRDSENLLALLEREDINITMITDWFKLNKKDTDTREFTYAEIPQHYIRNYCLLEIQTLLNRHERSLAEFQDLPHPNSRLLTNLDNRLIREALDFDVDKIRVEHEQLHSLLNPKQCLVYDKDEAPMTQRYAFEALDKTLRDKLGYKSLEKRNRIFGGMTVFLGEIDLRKQNFNRWVLAVGDGKLLAMKKVIEDEPTWIEILEEFLIKLWSNLIENIVLETYLDFTTRQTDKSYLKERAILTPRNNDVDTINEFMFKTLGGVSITYNSADEICKASTNTKDQHHLYPIEFLNTLNFPRMPLHVLCLKRELLIMLIRNVNPTIGMCNGTRLIINDLWPIRYSSQDPYWLTYRGHCPHTQNHADINIYQVAIHVKTKTVPT